MTQESHLHDIESRYAYQEKTLQELSDVVYTQQQEIDQLKKKVTVITNALNEVLQEVSRIGAPAANEKPPHY